MKHPTTWGIIADGARARLVDISGCGKDLKITEIEEFSGDHDASRDLLRDRPSRVHKSHGHTRHAVERKSDPHRELKRHFADVLAEALDEAFHLKRFDRLVIVAPPVTMGDLRKALTGQVKDAVCAELAMDLTKVPNSEISSHLEGAVPT